MKRKSTDANETTALTAADLQRVQGGGKHGRIVDAVDWLGSWVSESETPLSDLLDATD